MRKMTQAERDNLYQLVLERDGAYCHIGGEEGSFESLHLVAWDNNWENRDPENCRLVCFRMFHIMNPPSTRLRPEQVPSSIRRECESASDSANELPRSTSLEFLKNLRAEPAFNHWLFEQVYTREKVPYKEVVNGGALKARVTQKTSREYADKQSSPQGMYMIVKEGEEKFIRLKPQWETFRKVIEARKTFNRQVRNWQKDKLKGLLDTSSISRGRKDRPEAGESPEQPTDKPP